MRDCTLTWENSPSHTHAAAGLTTQSLPVLGQPLQKPLKGCGGAFAQNEKTAAEPRTTPPTHNRELQYPTTQTPYYPLSQTGKAARGSQHATPRHRPLQKVRALEQHPAHHKRPNSWHAVTPVASLHMSPPMACLSLSLSLSLTHSLTRRLALPCFLDLSRLRRTSLSPIRRIRRTRRSRTLRSTTTLRSRTPTRERDESSFSHTGAAPRYVHPGCALLRFPKLPRAPELRAQRGGYK